MLRTLRDRRAAQPERGDPARARRPARRPWLLILVAAFLVVAAWLTGQLTSTRGWLMVALAWVLVVALAGHRDAGGRRRLLRTLAEYAVVAVLAVLLVTGAGVAKPTLPRSAGRTTAGTGQLCPDAVQGVAGDACDFLAKVWRAAKQAKNRAATTTSPTTTTRRRP
jgi:peptidoglycan/LPS O-acetylase OafA/YrhL